MIYDWLWSAWRGRPRTEQLEVALDFAVEVRNLSKEFPLNRSYRELLLHPFRHLSVTALQRVNLRVRPGELFVLLGPNGAGKTTLIKILTTLLLPTEGEAWVNGCEVRKDARRVKEMVGYCIGSERSFYWRLTGRENLHFFATLNNLASDATRRVDDVLRIVELDEVADQMFATYSAGMRQRLGIARALLTRPSVLFMDEPSRSLDPMAATRVQRFIREKLVKVEHKTVFCATHNLGEARYLADSLGIISRGQMRVCDGLEKVLQEGSLDEVFARAAEGA